MTVTRQRLPWGQFIGTGCRCDSQVPCLYHYSDLDWRAAPPRWPVPGSGRLLGGSP